MSMLDRALEYAEQGFKVFPCSKNAKTPACAGGFKAATNDLVRIRELWTDENFNIGFEPESAGLCVVDVDVKNGHDGQAAWESFGITTPTYTVQTPSGGKHLYFSGSLPPSASKLGPGLDIRGRDSYILLPPSVVDGKPYIEIDGHDPAELPGVIKSRLTTFSSAAVAALPEIELDTQINIDRAIEHLKGANPAIEFQGSDADTFKVACAVRDFGISQDTALDLIWEHWVKRCVGNWTEEYVANKVENAYRYGKNAAGAYAVEAPEKVFGEIIAKLFPCEKNGTFNPIFLSELLMRNVPPVQYLIDGIIEKTIATILSAPGGSHKSRLLKQWGLCVGTGTKIFGRTVEPATFIYLSYEDHCDEVTRRVQAIVNRLELPRTGQFQYMDLTITVKHLVTVTENGIEETAFGTELRAYLLAIDGHKFLGIDSIYNALQFHGQAKINESSVKAAIEWLNRLCVETDSTILALWHPSQSGQERGDASGWSVAWHNTPRARLSLTAVKDVKDAFELRCEKRNNAARGEPITLHWDGGALLPNSDLDAAKQGTRLLDACIDTAINAAKNGQPIQKQLRLMGWMLDDIEKLAGFRPTNRQVKEELSRGMSLNRLRYLQGTRHRTAGYYPPDMRDANDLAHQAKNATKNGADNG